MVSRSSLALAMLALPLIALLGCSPANEPIESASPTPSADSPDAGETELQQAPEVLEEKPADTGAAGGKLKALIVDGQNNHDWQATTPVLKKILEESGRFTVAVSTSPPATKEEIRPVLFEGKPVEPQPEMADWRPDFAAYDVVISNYNGLPWSRESEQAFEEFVSGGGGFVAVHAADNSFPHWKEYNRMIGVGGWGGRNEASGPYVRWRDGAIVRDEAEGKGGAHGKQSAFEVVARDPEHPILKGLPPSWMHAQDELYGALRGPAENMHVLATGYSDPATGGTGEHEPLLFTVDYGKGRVFHTTLGHSPEAMRCVGFITTLVRGAEWAATGKVTLDEVPEDFPSGGQVSVRE